MSDPFRSVQGMNPGNEEVSVKTDPSGMPLSVHRSGRTWVVGAEPLRWYERTTWWRDAQRMPKGQGRMDVQVWRVQARLGRNERSELVTMDLERAGDGGPWRLREGVAA